MIIYALNKKHLNQESKSLDFFLKRRFCAISKEQLQEYVRSNETTLPPYCAVMTAHQNWILDEILTLTSVKDRGQTIERIIQLAQFFYKMGNYPAFLSILSSLKEPAIARLKHSWDWVPEKSTKWFLKQVQLCLTGNPAHLFKLMAERKEPYFPHLPAIKNHYHESQQKMHSILDNLSRVQDQLRFLVQQEKMFEQSCFVNGVKKWQTQEQQAQGTSFLNRSLLLE